LDDWYISFWKLNFENLRIGFRLCKSGRINEQLNQIFAIAEQYLESLFQTLQEWGNQLAAQPNICYDESILFDSLRA
jgi:hypothetical protein